MTTKRVSVPMSEESQREMRLTLALLTGWIIRAIEEYGVGGAHKPDTEGFLLAAAGHNPSSLMARVGRLYEQLGCVLQTGETVNDVTRRLIENRGALGDGSAARTS